MIRTLGWTLLHFVWQGAAVAAALAAADLISRRADPRVRYALACASLLLMAALPAVTFRALSLQGDGATPSLAVLPDGDAALAAPVTSVAAAGLPEATPLDRGIEALLPAVVALWSLGVVLLTLRAFGGLALVRRLGRSGLSEAPRALEATLVRLARSLGIRTRVRLYESALVGVPTVVGWLKPVVLLPASALSGLTAHQLELILAHELAHVRRHDYLVNLLQSAAETLLFYHPAVWWVSSRVRAEREHCCDDLAVRACGGPLGYARALVELEGVCSDAPAMALSATGGSLFARVARLVGRSDEPSRAARGALAALFVLSLAVALGLGSALLDRAAPLSPDVMAAANLVDTSPLSSEAPAGILETETSAPAPETVPEPPSPASPRSPVAPASPVSPASPAAPPQGGPAQPQARAFPLERVLEMARAGVTPEYVDAMDALGYASLAADELIALRQQGVGPDYVRELAALGYERLSAEQLLGLRAQGVSPGFVKGLAEQGLSGLSSSNLQALRAQGVSPQYVAELREAGLEELSVTSLLALRGQGVSGRYAAELKALGYEKLSEPQLLALRSQGVGADYVRSLAELGYRNLDTKLLLALRSQGVSTEFVRALQGLGYRQLEVGQLIALRAQGVTPEYVRELQQAGYAGLSAEDLIGLRSQGVSPSLLQRLGGRNQQ